MAIKYLQVKERKQRPKSFEPGFDRLSQRITLKILDPEGMYPFLLIDPKAGTYTIRKTRNGKLEMTK